MPKSVEKIERTKRAISEALLRLLERKPLAKVTIGEVADEAQLSRGTVYRYYDNIYDILFECSKDYYVGLSHGFARIYDASLTPDGLYELLVHDYQERARIIASNPRLFLDVMRSRSMLMGSPSYDSFIGEALRIRMRMISIVAPDESRYRIPARLIACCLLENADVMCIDWVKDGCAKAPQEIARETADNDFAIMRGLTGAS